MSKFKLKLAFIADRTYFWHRLLILPTKQLQFGWLWIGLMLTTKEPTISFRKVMIFGYVNYYTNGFLFVQFSNLRNFCSALLQFRNSILGRKKTVIWETRPSFIFRALNKIQSQRLMPDMTHQLMKVAPPKLTQTIIMFTKT